MNAPKNLELYPPNPPGWKKNLPPLSEKKQTLSKLVTMKTSFCVITPREMTLLLLGIRSAPRCLRTGPDR